MMKKALLLLTTAFVLFACSEDEANTCPETDNALIAENCYWGFMSDYDVQGEWSPDGQLVRIISEELYIEFRGAGPTYNLTINAGDYFYDPDTQQWITENGILTEGATYTKDDNGGTGMSAQGIQSNDAFTITLTKVDRTSKLISGSFRWEYTAANAIGDGQGTVVVEGTFDDVVANISDQI